MCETQLLKILEQVNVLNYDNGKKFTKTDRLEQIEKLLWNTSYRRINVQGLYHLYAKKPIDEIDRELLVISTHVDCQKNITRCFTEYENDYLRGTFDNSATNAAVLTLMVNDCLPDHVVIAFTGDEENDSKGAIQVAKYLRKKEKEARAVIVLDVTDMGWRETCDFTIENNFFGESLGKQLMEVIAPEAGNWRFVPSDVANIPEYIPTDHVIRSEAEPDESWDYDEEGCTCFSLCVPVCGDMHSDAGVLLRKEALVQYCAVLKAVAQGL